MTPDELCDFIENKMRMSHIYQPVLIKALVDAGGSATIRQLAQTFISQDESQLRYYEKRVKEMPVRVLKRHKVVVQEDDLVSLNVKRMTLEQQAKIRFLCEKRLQEYVQKKGLNIWDYRMLDTDPVSDSLYYDVLKESGGRCALCGTTKKDRPLEVDHIIPRSRGGKTTKENLQVLCSKCNRAKSNKDRTDFRNDLGAESDPDCPFCSEQVKDRIKWEYKSVIAKMV